MYLQTSDYIYIPPQQVAPERNFLSHFSQIGQKEARNQVGLISREQLRTIGFILSEWLYLYQKEFLRLHEFHSQVLQIQILILELLKSIFILKLFHKSSLSILSEYNWTLTIKRNLQEQ